MVIRTLILMNYANVKGYDHDYESLGDITERTNVNGLGKITQGTIEIAS